MDTVEQIAAQIEARRNDAAFTERVRRIIAQEHVVFERLLGRERRPHRPFT